ncbi:type II toxin-antitoxin system Phd/YefM family antitoxin [bacterium]|nr:MAG: type II toxin-antitoxin system Phd/YefM family antitoxin [bacterium]
MSIATTYTDARAHLAEYMAKAESTRETVIISRRGREDMALLAASELSSLMETAHLLRSPKNAERLLSALARSREESSQPTSIEELKKALGFDEK